MWALLSSLPKLDVTLTSFLTSDLLPMICSAGEALMRARLFNLPELDGTLACRVNMPQNQAALEFAVHVVRVCLVSEALATAADLFSTLDVLQKYAMRTSAGTAILQLVEQARQVARWAHAFMHLRQPGCPACARCAMLASTASI